MIKANRQGDVYTTFLDPADLPKNLGKKVIDKNHPTKSVLAYGEVTHHHHRLDSKTSTLYELERGDIERICKKYMPEYKWQELGDGSVRLLQVTEDTPLVHEEHSEITHTKEQQWYIVTIQQQYSPEFVSRVTD